MYKTIFSLIIIFVFINFNNIYPQYKNRESGFSYVGGGYSLVFFTNSEVSDIYPIFDIRSGRFISEFNAFYGYQISKKVAVEISPSFIYTSSSEPKGFFYVNSNYLKQWYEPQSASLVEIPINLKFKYFPFGSSNDFKSGLFFSAGTGIVYIKEQYDDYIYSDSTTAGYPGISIDRSDLLTWNTKLALGYSAIQRFGYGIDISYRIIPLNTNKITPLVFSRTSNFNSLNISLKFLFGF